MNWNPFRKNSTLPGDHLSHQDKEALLHSLLIERDYTKLPAAFPMLLTSSADYRTRTVEAIHTCVSNLTNKELLLLDPLFREMYFDKHDSWRNEYPGDLHLADWPEEEKISISGLCTFHPNGYVREEAMNLLASFHTGKELPFLLIRCNDWVSEIRSLARRLTEDRIEGSQIEAFTANLPVIFKLKNANRADHDVLFEKITGLLSRPEALPFLHEGTQSKEHRIRLVYYDMIIRSGQANKENLMDYFRRETEPHGRLILFGEIMNEISESVFQRFYTEFKKDKFPRIRAAVLQKAVEIFPNHSLTELEAALFDKSGTVRSLARYLLSKRNISDFASYYTEAIMKQSGANLREALLGIGETGRKEHAVLVLPLVKSDEAGITKAAARALAMLDPDSNREAFISLLSHDHPGVSKEARRSLQAALYEDKAEELYRIYKEADAPHSRYQAAVLLCSLSKWASIRYILELYVNEDNPAISRLGQQQAAKWLAGYNRSFTVPSKEQAASVRTALSKYGSGLREWEREQLEFCLKGY
ncbi:hypothetical protein GKZ89_15600 [Bacillus mangrovi]|uniref:HEAT repeat domain-containing protein n=1 Tax=Metabacillus mangrovi TaxID=1491830 RepID=A0A7X2S719_9BACI|nr:HEAT repeat domain-containing protein [Metabacillus mangrovi]MTH54827.1 hypothetical protein [Metabacillus mangrovi]